MTDEEPPPSPGPRTGMAGMDEADEQRYRLAQEAARFGIWEWDLESDRIYWDAASWRMLGYEPAQDRILSYAEWRTQIHPADLERIEPMVREGIARGEPFTIEFRYRHADGGWLWIQGRGQTTRWGPDRAPAYVMGAHVEIEQLKETEAALRQREQALSKSERRFRQMAESIDEIFLLRTGNELLYINPACERFLGYPPEAFGSDFNSILAMVHPEDRERTRAAFQEAEASGEPSDVVHRIVRRDGEVRWFHTQGYLLHDEQDGCLLRTGTARDVTAYKALQHQLEAANQAKSTFLNAVSHDLRTPLNALMGFTDLLAESPLDAEQRRYIALCQSAAQRLLGLIDTLLELTSLQNGQVEASRQPVALRSFLEAQLELMRRQATGKGLALAGHVDPDLPTYVETDPNRLAQVLFNLIGNAIDYTEAGSVEVAVERDSPERARITVQDTGPGISQERQQRIFEPFERGGQAERQEHHGLGLAVARELARVLGGDIELDSEPGAGSTFTVTLDLPAASDEAPAAPPSGPAAGADAERPGEGLRVLAAEDDGTNALLLQRLLEGAGCTVKVVADGEAALAAAARLGPDLVVLDLEMPRMDGYQAVEALRAQEAAQRAPRTPVAALTAHALQETRQACYAAGFDTYLSKPVGWPAISQLLAWAHRFREDET